MRVAAAALLVGLGVALPSAAPPSLAQCMPSRLEQPFARAAESGCALHRVDEPRSAGAPALAQPDPYRPYRARPARSAPAGAAEVAASLKARGFVDVSDVRQRGGTYLAEATGPRGERVRLVVDGASGEISGMQVIGFGPPR